MSWINLTDIVDDHYAVTPLDIGSGGTGLASGGKSNQYLSMNNEGSALEYKNLDVAIEGKKTEDYSIPTSKAVLDSCRPALLWNDAESIKKLKTYTIKINNIKDYNLLCIIWGGTEGKGKDGSANYANYQVAFVPVSEIPTSFSLAESALGTAYGGFLSNRTIHISEDGTIKADPGYWIYTKTNGSPTEIAPDSEGKYEHGIIYTILGFRWR